MYSQAFDHMHDRSAVFEDDDAVYTDPDSLQIEVKEDRLVQRRSRGKGTGFRKKQNNAQFLDLGDDMMGQSHTTEYMDVVDINPRETSPQRYERSRSDGHILQDRQVKERGLSQPVIGFAGHTNEESTDYCYAVEPGTTQPELRKKPPVPQRSISVKEDYSLPPDRLSHAKSQDYTEPYQVGTEGNKSPNKNPSGPPDPGIYEFAKEPVSRRSVESEDNPYNSTYNHITSGFNKAKLAEIEDSYDRLNTLHSPAHGAINSENTQPRVTSPRHKHSNTPFNFPATGGVKSAKMQGCHTGEIPPNYEEPWDTHAGQRKLSRLLDKAEKTAERRESLDKQSGQTEQNIAQNVRRTAANRNPSVGSKDAISETSGPGACTDQQNDLYETSWGPNVNRNSLERNQNNNSDTTVQPKAKEMPPPVRHAPIPANYEDAWDLPEKQKEFEEKLEQARKKRTSQGQIRADASGEPQPEKVRSPESKFPPEVTMPPVLPAPRIRPVPVQRDNCKRSDSCRSLGALAEKIDRTIPLQDQLFYHGAIKRSDAEKMLLVFKEGSYLIRRSETCKKDYSLTLKGWNGIAMHMKIVGREDGTYILGENSPPFNTIPDMVDYYTTHELPVQNAERICLLYPIPS